MSIYHCFYISTLRLPQLSQVSIRNCSCTLRSYYTGLCCNDARFSLPILRSAAKHARFSLPTLCSAAKACKVQPTNTVLRCRTESTAYPNGFDFTEVLAAQRRHPIWGEYTSAIMTNGFTAPKVNPNPNPSAAIPHLGRVHLSHHGRWLHRPKGDWVQGQWVESLGFRHKPKPEVTQQHRPTRGCPFPQST